MTRSMQELHQCGQSVWLDFITRQFMSDGKLAALIANDGVRTIRTGFSVRRAKPIRPFSSRLPGVWALLAKAVESFGRPFSSPK